MTPASANSPSSPLVIAHRGASAAEPENTLAAFRAAKTLGADWVELDVRRTADGTLAVHHDERLTDGRALVDLDRAALPSEVAVLSDALDACAGMGVNIEIKNWPDDADFDPDRRLADAVVALVASRGDRARVLVSCFDLATADRVHALDPGIETAWLTARVDEPAVAADRCVRHGHVALHPWAPLVDAALVDACHAVGVRVNTWTVDDPGWMARLADMGIDGIVTNVPDVARSVLDRRGE
jgi:glycerophosphoryl diester phosphodiesterase